MTSYPPLDITRQQIRLLHLENYPTYSGLPYTLAVFDLADAPPYTALSYTWGPPSPTQHISINEHHFEIRQNLYDFLVRFELVYDVTVPTYLWIDQICIDQANVIERNHQVGLMSAIYLRSRDVLIWLGSDQPNFATDTGRSYYEVAKDFQRKRKWEDLYLLFDNDYFRRLWVVQEIILAHKILVLIDHSYMDWNVIRQCADDMNRRMILGIRFYHSRLLSMSARGTPSDRTLKDCIDTFSSYLCSDPRDKIYGLMGMVRAKDRLVVDYNKTPEDIVLDIGQVFLKRIFEDPSPFALKIDGLRTTMINAAHNMEISEERSQSLDNMLRENWTVKVLNAVKKMPGVHIIMSFHPGAGTNSGVWHFALRDNQTRTQML